eukprot:17087-Heterococcus_DN1.PRE.2
MDPEVLVERLCTDPCLPSLLMDNSSTNSTTPQTQVTAGHVLDTCIIFHSLGSSLRYLPQAQL